MRTTPIILLLVVVVAGCANIKNNPLAREDQKKTEFIVDYKGLNKDALFSEVIKAMALVFKSSKEVIEMQDRAGGDIVGNGYTSFKTQCKGGAFSEMPYEVSYTIQISVKDEKVRYRYLPTVEKVGMLTEADLKKMDEEQRAYFTDTECYWAVLSEYFQSVTELMSKNIMKDDDF